MIEIAAEAEEKCRGCGSAIDPVTCWCGARPEDGHDNHYFIPMGCDCHRTTDATLARVLASLEEGV